MFYASRTSVDFGEGGRLSCDRPCKGPGIVFPNGAGARLVSSCPLPPPPPRWCVGKSARPSRGQRGSCLPLCFQRGVRDVPQVVTRIRIRGTPRLQLDEDGTEVVDPTQHPSPSPLLKHDASCRRSCERLEPTCPLPQSSDALSGLLHMRSCKERVFCIRAASCK